MMKNTCIKMGGCGLEKLAVKMFYSGLLELPVSGPDKLGRVHTILLVKAF
jgi:hypothetical protein